MKDTLKVGVIQMKIESDMLDPSLKDKNVAHALELLDRMGAEKPDLVVMPDEWYSGQSYGPMSMVDFREKGGFDKLGEAAKKNGFYLVGAVMDPPDPPQGFKSHSLGYVISPEGKLVGKAAAIHATREGRPWIVPGGRPNVIETELGALGVVVGYDIFQPEVARILALKGAEVLINPILFIDNVDGFQDTDFGMNYYSVKSAWRACGLARAHEDQVFFIGCCGVGTFPRADMFEYCGTSFVAGPAGLKREAGDKEEVFTCELKKAEMTTTRRLFDLLASRNNLMDTLKE